ncbi:hypothetical protein ABGB16_20725 [Micromonospora sp. B11E3]|uniref:hypothetical protein n=1 Tax=Micromonospora sp. B11E3 TaxID=3153562 RepID=UPI00325E06B6
MALVFPAIAVAVGYQVLGYPGVPFGFILAAIATWYVGRLMNRSSDGPDEYHNEHTFFSIPVQYWSLLWLFFALAQLINMALGTAGWQQ